MKMNISLYRYVSIALLAALAVVFQVFHVGYLSPWGMWIDIVAVPVLLALFLFDTKDAFLVAVLLAMVISVAAPSGFVGATMKFVTTLPMFLVIGLVAQRRKLDVSNVFHLVPLLLLAVAIRAVVSVYANYYWALPIWLNISTEQAFATIPWGIVAGMNVLQGVIEVGIAWTLAFKFKLVERYGMSRA